MDPAAPNVPKDIPTEPERITSKRPPPFEPSEHVGVNGVHPLRRHDGNVPETVEDLWAIVVLKEDQILEHIGKLEKTVERIEQKIDEVKKSVDTILDANSGEAISRMVGFIQGLPEAVTKMREAAEAVLARQDQLDLISREQQRTADQLESLKERHHVGNGDAPWPTPEPVD